MPQRARSFDASQCVGTLRLGGWLLQEFSTYSGRVEVRWHNEKLTRTQASRTTGRAPVISSDRWKTLAVVER